MSGEVEANSEFFVGPQVVATKLCKDLRCGRPFLLSSSVWTTVKAQRDKIASWSARVVANVIGVKRPPWMGIESSGGDYGTELAIDWIEKGNTNVLTAIREIMLSWAGHVARMDHKEICAKALRCRGLQWWRWRQLHWKEVEKDKWSGPRPQRFKIYRREDMVAGEVSKFTGNADGLPESVQENTGWLHLARNRGSWKEFSKCGRSPVQMVPGASGTHVRLA